MVPGADRALKGSAFISEVVRVLYSTAPSAYALRVDLLISLYCMVSSAELEAKFKYLIGVIFRAYSDHYYSISLILSP